MVYVDDMLMTAAVPNGNKIVRGQWSHLTADTTEELHEFAARLGMRRNWFQPARLVPDTEYTRKNCPHKIGKPFPGSRDHYDVTAPVRRKAIALGAIPVKMGCEPWRDRKKERSDEDEVYGPAEPGAPAEATGSTGRHEPVNDGSHYGQ